MSRTRQPVSNSPQTTTESQETPVPFPTTLRLRAEEAPPEASEETAPSRRIRWSEDVVDNEGMGKKSSKVCCIYHKARPVGESSSESSSSDSDDSDSEEDRRTARMKSRRTPNDPHGHDRECANDHDHSKPKKAKRKPSPNAYEKMPKPSKNHDPTRGS